MLSFKVLFGIAFGLLALSSTTEVQAYCNVCSQTSYAACINETSFHVCVDGQTPSKQIETCKENMVCTDSLGVCQPNVPGVVLACALPKCNDCSGSTPFTCVSQTQFAFCAPGGTVGYVSTCDEGKVCSLEEFVRLGQICGLSCATKPTCRNIEPEAPPEGDWKETCDSQTTTGYYINVHNTTCKEYVYCESVNGVMSAVKYECGARYFDVVAKQCVDKKPATCT